MASIHRKAKNGVWYISYRQGGKLEHRSLGTTSGTEARRLQKQIELEVEAKPEVEFFVSERPRTEAKNPTVDEFRTEFLNWASRLEFCGYATRCCA